MGGRSRDGDLLFGETKHDCTISHGVAAFLKEQLVGASDDYPLHVCQTSATALRPFYGFT